MPLLHAIADFPLEFFQPSRLGTRRQFLEGWGPIFVDAQFTV
jgi:hypothetical protein